MKRIGFVMAAVLAAVTGCSSMTASADSPPLDGTAWVLSSLAGRSASGPAATARFEAGRVQGTDGCNRYSAAFTTKGPAIEIGPRGAATQMACTPEVMQRAEAFAAALANVRSYRVSAGQLQLIGADGAVLAQLVAQPQSLAGTTWRATAINNGKGAVAGTVTDTNVTLSFAEDGRASGSGGCNRYTASYQAEGSSLKFTPAAATRKLCPTPGVMEQEQAFFRALESVATFRMEADRLEMRTDAGAMALLLSRSSAP